MKSVILFLVLNLLVVARSQTNIASITTTIILNSDGTISKLVTQMKGDPLSDTNAVSSEARAAALLYQNQVQLTTMVSNLNAKVASLESRTNLLVVTPPVVVIQRTESFQFPPPGTMFYPGQDIESRSQSGPCRPYWYGRGIQTERAPQADPFAEARASQRFCLDPDHPLPPKSDWTERYTNERYYYYDRYYNWHIQNRRRW